MSTPMIVALMVTAAALGVSVGVTIATAWWQSAVQSWEDTARTWRRSCEAWRDLYYRAKGRS